MVSTAWSSGALSMEEVAAWSAVAATVEPVACRLVVGQAVWKSIHEEAVTHPAESVSGMGRLLGVPIKVDREGDPYRWMMLDRDGQAMAAGRLGESDGGAT